MTDEATEEWRAEQRPDATIFERMNWILDELPAIGKTQTNRQQGFNFRGHDDVMNALTPLLAKHGVFIVPRVLERVSSIRTTASNKAMYEVNLHVEYTFYGEKGDHIVASAWGEGTDSGDKSTNKAMTMAFKNVIAQAFAINTEEASAYDADKHSPEDTFVPRAAAENVEPAKPARKQMPTPTQRGQFNDKLKHLEKIAPEDKDRKQIDWSAWAADWVMKRTNGTQTLETLERAPYQAMLEALDAVIAKVEAKVHDTFERVVDDGAVEEALEEAGAPAPEDDVDIPFGEPAST